MISNVNVWTVEFKFLLIDFHKVSTFSVLKTIPYL